MTAPPFFVLEEVRRYRERRNSICTGALLTSAFVAAGFGIASLSISHVSTPSDVAKAYAEARFDRDWSTAWDLLCRPARSANGDYLTYANRAADGFHLMPWDVEISTGRAHGVDGSAIAVPVTVSSQEPLYRDWRVDDDLILVLEDDRFRVCEHSPAPA